MNVPLSSSSPDDHFHQQYPTIRHSPILYYLYDVKYSPCQALTFLGYLTLADLMSENCSVIVYSMRPKPLVSNSFHPLTLLLMEAGPDPVDYFRCSQQPAQNVYRLHHPSDQVLSEQPKSETEEVPPFPVHSGPGLS